MKKHVRRSLIICSAKIAGGFLLKMPKHSKVVLNIFELLNVKDMLKS